MKSSQILRRAADWLADENQKSIWGTGRPTACGGCHAIAHVWLKDWMLWNQAYECPAFQYYEAFRPTGAFPSHWFDNQSDRLTALCLAAAIAESEGD